MKVRLYQNEKFGPGILSRFIHYKKYFVQNLFVIFQLQVTHNENLNCVKNILKIFGRKSNPYTEKKKMKRASIYSCLSSYNEGSRGFLFIVYSAKLMLLNGRFQFLSYACSSDNTFVKAHVFSCKYEKISFDDEAFVRTAKIGQKRQYLQSKIACQPNGS